MKSPGDGGNIYLVGMMGAGKSSVGTELGERLGRRVLDLDEIIESTEGRTIAEIFETVGEERFRELETLALGKAAGEGGLVVSTGGGVVLRGTNRAVMSASGVTVYLRAEPEALWSRIGHAEGRPLLGRADPQGALRGIYEARRGLYELSDLEILTEGLAPRQVAARVIELLDGLAALTPNPID